MRGRTHLVAGLFLCTFFPFGLTWLFVLLGSLLPDIDEPRSLLGRRAKPVGRVFTHRGFFHSLLFALPATIIIGSFGMSYGIAFGVGIVSHLLLDMLTRQGIRLFPLRTKLRGPFQSGGMVDLFLFFGFIVLFFLRL